MKQKRTFKILGNTLLYLAFAAAVFVFFGFYYNFHLNYQEQFQLFLYTPTYFLDFASRPGGIADYLGSFFTQFYFYSGIGALVLAVLLSKLALLIQSAALKLGAAGHWAPLTLIPSFLYWSLLCDENYLLGGLISMIMLALFINIFLLFRPGKVQSSAVFLLLILLYWMAGGVYVLFALFVFGARFFAKSPIGKTDLITAVFLLILTLLLPYLAKSLVLQFPMMKFLTGTTYFRFPVNLPLSVALIAVSIFALPLLLALLSRKLYTKKSTFMLVALTLLIGFPAYFLIRKSADFAKEEVMAYDFHIRMRKWDRAIALADNQAPTSPLSVTCLNLALAKQDLLGERMFHYFQNGTGGLIPDFTRDFTIPLIAGEVYYHLGLVNTAQRFAFEAMEALPDYRKSARAVKRLAETNIINGEYTLARKYLHILEQTFYYRGWARQALETIKDETKVNDHPEWGWLRKARIENDFLFSEQEKENMLGLLFTHNPKNRMAFEYLLASSLVKKDLQSFLRYFPLAKSVEYKAIPYHFQEALLYSWEASNQDPGRKIPYAINPALEIRFGEYKRLFGQTRDPKAMQNKFGDTYWYYLQFRN